MIHSSACTWEDRIIIRIKSLISWMMDEGIRKVVGSLKKRGMIENTIFVFTSDNGAFNKSLRSNYPLRGRKSTYLEGGGRGVTFVNSPLLQKTINNLHLF